MYNEYDHFLTSTLTDSPFGPGKPGIPSVPGTPI